MNSCHPQLNNNFHFFEKPCLSTCVEFDTSKGIWSTVYKLPYRIAYHTSWKNSRGILLMGNVYSGTRNKTLQLLPDGKHKPSFDLVQETYGACNIEDPSTNSVIMTGGYNYALRRYLNSVVRYGEQGFIEFLPNTTSTYYVHGCAGYYEGKNQV